MFSIEEYVTPSRTGRDGKLKFVSAVDMMQDCSQLWMKSEPVLEQYFGENNMAQLLASRQMDVLRMPEYGERLTITTSVFECQNIQGYRNTVIYDEGHKPCVVSWSTGAFVNLSTNRLAKVPQEIFSGMVFDDKVEMEYLDRKITVPEGDVTQFPPVQVMSNDIDMNRHMNNAHYVRVAMEFLPEDFRTDRLRIEYKKPAEKGDMLYPRLIRTDKPLIYIQLLDGNSQPHAVMEFSRK
ncbi:acyl-ACP thioesterase [Dysgonomonas sp. 521]|uniref:acyl-[acyl-carrier-protein] thioesterase n=1 Tax=Dysgonomonas sp. 521 TaxID=2302932 RepID=UPI0013D7AA0A|nr:acyl-ACP thioesterase domain-containing protein [Dysgonomonas sp. 521]NDV95014.1 acyl-ACP thioesterase [Dysgonomonas sp. 521]